MAEPIRVGILDDLAPGAPGVVDSGRWVRLVANDARDAGRLDREVELIHAYGVGLPHGTAVAVERAFAELVAQDVLVIAGPAVGHNALVATPLAERAGIPTINWAGSERARGSWMFHLQVGSHEDESIVLADHLHELRAERVAVVYDRSPIGHRHLQFLQSEADVLGVQLVAVRSVATTAEQAGTEVAELLAARPDAVVYLGLGLSAPAVAGELAAARWDGPRLMTTAGIRGHDPAYAELVDGWTYLDMYADDNRTLQWLRGRADVPACSAVAAAKGYDLGRLVVEGLARASDLTREGVRDGLEQIKWLPAAEGEEGTLLGFGHHDRGALHGRYLVLRRWADGRSVQVTIPRG